MSLCNFTPNGVLAMELVMGTTLNEEMRRRSQASSSQSKVFITEDRG